MHVEEPPNIGAVEGGRSSPGSGADDSLEMLPLSYGQQRLWFLQQMNPGDGAYNVPLGLRLKGQLDWEALEGALGAIVGRHEILRTVYSTENGTPVQWVSAEPEFKVARVTMEDAPADELETKLGEEARRPFDLSRELMVRATVFELRPDERVLLLVLHHIAADEWSLNILLKELEEGYRSRVLHERLVLPELPIQYGDFALWQRDFVESEVLGVELSYWREQLKGELPVLALPADVELPRGSSTAGGQWTRDLPVGLMESLAALGRAHDTTLYVVLLAAYGVFLHRYARQPEVMIGSPISGRTRHETEKLIGFFVNTLPLRLDASGRPNFLEFLGRVRQTVLGGMAHQETPFEKLVEELRPDRGLGKVPLVQTMFAVEQTRVERMRLPGLEVDLLDVHNGTAKFDLTVVVRSVANGSSVLSMEFNRGLLGEETAERMAGLYIQLLEEIAANPNRTVGRLPWIRAEERERLLVGWNRTATEYPRELTLAQLFERQVVERPEAIAVVHHRERGSKGEGQAQEQWTYEEINARANRMARRLIELGVKSAVPVGICVQRSADMIVSLLAVVKAGGAYVPLDPAYPADRLGFMIADSGTPVVIAERRFFPMIQSRRAVVFSVDETLGDYSAEALEWGGSPEDLAYIIYTSGSTGRPKGVMVPQRGIVRLVCGSDYVQLGPSDRVAQVSNACFDAATFEIWGPLLNGGTIVIMDRDVSLEPREFARVLREESVTTLFLTTALFNQMAREAPGAFGQLKHLLFGGEMADPGSVREVLEHEPPQRLLHVYGPTECTTFATWHEVREVLADARTVPIGRPIANTEAYVLDDELEPIPVGVVGEIYLGGDGVALGYRERPELTASRFVPDPFSGKAGARIYRTGDLARRLADGSIEFIGRLDHQVKIRGFRVELGEIESVLLAHPSIREAVVDARKDETIGTLKLVAYYVGKSENSEGGVEAIRQFLKERLPDYMVPSWIVPMAQLPLNANGKKDRKALPAPDSARTAREYQSPRDEVERKLVAVWEQVLGISPVGVTDNFFDLGGHSLLAVRLFSQTEEVLGRKLPLATLFQSPTIEKIAQVIRAGNESGKGSVFVSIQPKGTRPPMFWVHSLGGDGGGGFFYYRKLSELLGLDQPSFGIRSPEEPFHRIEEMAAHYVERLVEFHPTGPYLLGGFCFGGNVAYEMARQLVAMGRPVGLLVLLESAAPCSGSASGLRQAGGALPVLNHLRSWLVEFIHQSPGEMLHRIRRKRKLLGKQIARTFSLSKRSESPAELEDVIDMAGYPAAYVKYAKAHWRALTQYTPGKYPGRITLFRARKQPLSRFDPTLGWGDLAAGGVTVNVIPGSHEKMLEEPNVHILATELKACLVELQAARG